MQLWFVLVGAGGPLVGKDATQSVCRNCSALPQGGCPRDGGKQNKCAHCEGNSCTEFALGNLGLGLSLLNGN